MITSSRFEGAGKEKADQGTLFCTTKTHSSHLSEQYSSHSPPTHRTQRSAVCKFTAYPVVWSFSTEAARPKRSSRLSSFPLCALAFHHPHPVGLQPQSSSDHRFGSSHTHKDPQIRRRTLHGFRALTRATFLRILPVALLPCSIPSFAFCLGHS
jgi:hypothetical protein